MEGGARRSKSTDRELPGGLSSGLMGFWGVGFNNSFEPARTLCIQIAIDIVIDLDVVEHW